VDESEGDELRGGFGEGADFAFGEHAGGEEEAGVPEGGPCAEGGGDCDEAGG
jgi:hypothetical protein